MPFGKYYPAENTMITTIYGDQVPLNKPAGYGGLFWGRVYDENEKKIWPASDYFWDLAKSDGHELEYEYWELIDSLIGEHCKKYVAPYSDDDHHYQYGFGGDECDGLIDFWVKDPIPKMPDMPFEVAGEKYVLKWEYSSGSDDD
jgi:hypothetical protein